MVIILVITTIKHFYVINNYIVDFRNLRTLCLCVPQYCYVTSYRLVRWLKFIVFRSWSDDACILFSLKRIGTQHVRTVTTRNLGECDRSTNYLFRLWSQIFLHLSTASSYKTGWETVAGWNMVRPLNSILWNACNDTLLFRCSAYVTLIAGRIVPCHMK